MLSLSCPAMSTHSMGVPMERMQTLPQAGRCAAVGLGPTAFNVWGGSFLPRSGADFENSNILSEKYGITILCPALKQNRQVLLP